MDAVEPSAAAAAASPREVEHAIEHAIEHEVERVQAGGFDWHVERYRAGRGGGAPPEDDAPRNTRDARPILLALHGTGASAHSWARIAPLLATRYDILAPDLPGHARTRGRRRADLSIAGCANAVEALLARLRYEPAVVVGHSAGAVVLAERALRVRPDATTRLVSINGAMLPLGVPGAALFRPLAKLGARLDFVPKLFAARAAGDPRQVQRLLDGTGSRSDADMLRDYGRLIAEPDHVAGVLRMMSQWDLPGFATRLPALAAPVHLFAGDADRTIPLRDARRLHALLARATLDVLPGLGHLAHEEAPRIVAERLFARLDEAAP